MSWRSDASTNCTCNLARASIGGQKSRTCRGRCEEGSRAFNIPFYFSRHMNWLDAIDHSPGLHDRAAGARYANLRSRRALR